MRARKTWKEAASIAKTIRQPSQETYFRTRDELIRDLPGSNTSSRQALADRADELLLALYGAPGRDSEIQQRFDAAKSFFDQHSLPHYQVHVFQAVADRLTERGHAGDLIEAAQASMASILTAVSHKNWVVSAMETHVAWLVNLGLKGAQLLRLRNKTRVWLSRQLQQLGSIGQFEYLLVGFDTAIELANTEIQRFKDSQNSARF